MRTAKELDPTIRTWAEVFSRYDIPIKAYQELYQRAFDVRQSRLQTGAEPPAMDATLLVSQWTGPYGLKAEYHRKQVATGRTLPANAESICALCHGSGFKRIERDGYVGSAPCKHS